MILANKVSIAAKPYESTPNFPKRHYIFSSKPM